MESRYQEYLRITGIPESFKYVNADSSLTESEDDLSDLDEWIKVSKMIDPIGGWMKKKALSSAMKKQAQMICDYCNKTFYKRECINKHMQVHMAKRYKCSFGPCQKQFQQLGGLNKHLKAHEGKM